MSLIKLLWCKIVGHKPSEAEYSKECDGSMESYTYCKRCGITIDHTTFYDCDDYPADALINVKLKSKEDE
jgi:hypothetical protein